ncbi:hypothetical protein [Halorussus salinisoli]|uniref:hypothetical protein n=1 Tax=Halorussus salinisoli TaxID=2558242 RepID=UPI0010C1A704|nr:hypothetical protein [Halorussus salinisoli]
MTSGGYQFGLLMVVFGGFVSLNSAYFGDSADFVGGFGMVVMLIGALTGVLGLLPGDSTERE